MRKKHIRSCGILLGLLAWNLAASSVAPVNFQELSTLASRVVVGRVERIESYSDGGSGLIRSRIQIAETSRVDGGVPAVFTLEMAGGTFGGLRQWIAGFPNLAVGDRLVLFLAADTTTPLGPTVGLWQGVFFVEVDTATGAETVLNHRRQPVLGLRNNQLLLQETATRPSGARMRLEDFLRQVSTLRSAGAADARR